MLGRGPSFQARSRRSASALIQVQSAVGSLTHRKLRETNVGWVQPTRSLIGSILGGLHPPYDRSSYDVHLLRIRSPACARPSARCNRDVSAISRLVKPSSRQRAIWRSSGVGQRGKPALQSLAEHGGLRGRGAGGVHLLQCPAGA